MPARTPALPWPALCSDSSRPAPAPAIWDLVRLAVPYHLHLLDLTLPVSRARPHSENPCSAARFRCRGRRTQLSRDSSQATASSSTRATAWPASCCTRSAVLPCRQLQPRRRRDGAETQPRRRRTAPTPLQRCAMVILNLGWCSPLSATS